MPLEKRKSKKAFEHNFKAELHAGKPKDQSLAIAYSVKRKAKKAFGGTVASGSKDMNLAKGGEVSAVHKRKNDSAHEHELEGRIRQSEKAARRTGASTRTGDLSNTSQSNIDSHKMTLKSNPPGLRGNYAEGGMIDHKSATEAQRGPMGSKTTRIKHPSMAQSPVFKVRMRDQEDDLQSSAGVNAGPQRQPPESDDEMGPDRQGLKVRDMQDEHSTHRKPYAKGGEVLAKGGEVRKHESSHVYNYDDEMSMKGVNKVMPTYTKGGSREQGLEHGRSEAGSMARKAHTQGTYSEGARRKAKETLEEMRSMPNPKLKGLAHGGRVDDPELGVHRPSKDPKKKGISTAGDELRKGNRDEAYKEHRYVIGEQRYETPHRPVKGLAKGGEVEASDYDHPLDGRYEDDLLDLGPSHDEGMSMADEHDEEGQDRQGPDTAALHMKRMAHGGEINGDGEMDMDHEDSIAAAIMARRDRLHAEIDSGSHDLDSAVKMAEGGEVDSPSQSDYDETDSSIQHAMDAAPKSNNAGPAGQAAKNEAQIYNSNYQGKASPLGRNRYAKGGIVDLHSEHEEEPNNEDQMSFEALKKENYNSSDLDIDQPEDSNEHGHEIDSDDHDMVSKIRKGMKSKRQFKAR